MTSLQQAIFYAFRYRTKSGSVRTVANPQQLPKYIQTSGAYEETKGREKAEPTKPTPTKATPKPADPNRPLHQKTVAELRSHAKSIGLGGVSKHRKGDLLAAIAKHSLPKPVAAKSIAKPVAKPASPSPIPNPANPMEHHHSLHQEMVRHLKASNLPDDLKNHYIKAATAVLKNMTPKAALRMRHFCKEFHFVESVDHVTDEWTKGGRQTTSGNRILGFFHPSKSRIVLDSGSEHNEKKSGLKTADIYAHEFAHAIDGLGFKVSRSKKWKAAFDAEIKDGRLSKYATTNVVEGFAEFGRIALSGNYKRHDVEKNFPQCVKLWKEWGLL